MNENTARRYSTLDAEGNFDAVSVTTGAGLIPLKPRTGYLTLANNGDQTVYWSNSVDDIATKGQPLVAGAIQPIAVTGGTDIHLRAASGTQDVRFWETLVK